MESTIGKPFFIFIFYQQPRTFGRLCETIIQIWRIRLKSLIWRQLYNPKGVNVALPSITMRWWLYGKNWTSVMMMFRKIPMIMLTIRRGKRMIGLTCSSLVLIKIWMKLGDILDWNHYPPFVKFSLKSSVRSPKREWCWEIQSLVQARNLRAQPLYPKGLTQREISRRSHGVSIVKKPWHTKETCWKLHDKPPNWKRKSCRDGCAFQAITEEFLEHQIISKTILFTKKQWKHLYKRFQSPKLPINPFCSLA